MPVDKIVRKPVATGNIVAATITPPEHGGRWDCNVCKEMVTEKTVNMFSLAIPMGGSSIFVDMCDACRRKMVEALTEIAL